MDENYVVEMLNITKKFPGIIANDNVTIRLKRGEVLALLGENGAGKSTLMSVLFGLYHQESGTIKVNGKVEDITGPIHANELGIGMVHQHFKLVQTFTVLQNIVLGREDVEKGVIKYDEARKKVMEISDKYKFDINPDALVKNITVGMQQRVEIIKMLYCNADILIFDEPTAVLTPQEIDELMEIIKSLKAEGKSIIIITHKLEEIKKCADRCSILRRGKYIDTVDVKTTSTETMAELMVGRKVNFAVEKQPAKPGEVLLEVKNLNLQKKAQDKKLLSDINFVARAGEITCIAGIDGNGQTELVNIITGLDTEGVEGEVLFSGDDVTKKSIRYRYEKGMGHIPEDRHKHGLVLDYSLAYNEVIQTYYTKKFSHNGFLKFEEINKYCDKLIEKFDIRSGEGKSTITRSMSGGNQQKAIVAREIDRNPKILIAVQPTRGLDVGAIEFIHKQLIKERDEGAAILLVSLDLSEVMDVSDRILVMYEGEIVGNLDPKKIDETELGLYMSGSKRGNTK